MFWDVIDFALYLYSHPSHAFNARSGEALLILIGITLPLALTVLLLRSVNCR